MVEGQPRTVVLVEDHPGYRLGISYAIEREPRLLLVGTFDDGYEAAEGLRSLKPDIALVDIGLPGLDGIGVLRAVIEAGLRTRVVVLSATTDPVVVRSALAIGAAGYLSKADEPAAICASAIAVAHGATVVSPSLAGGLVTRFDLVAHQQGHALTTREELVLRLVADGCSAPEIGRRLYVSASTVKTHLEHIYEKFGVHCRSAAVATAIREGMLEPSTTPSPSLQRATGDLFTEPHPVRAVRRR